MTPEIDYELVEHLERKLIFLNSTPERAYENPEILARVMLEEIRPPSYSELELMNMNYAEPPPARPEVQGRKITLGGVLKEIIKEIMERCRNG